MSNSCLRKLKNHSASIYCILLSRPATRCLWGGTGAGWTSWLWRRYSSRGCFLSGWLRLGRWDGRQSTIRSRSICPIFSKWTSSDSLDCYRFVERPFPLLREWVRDCGCRSLVCWDEPSIRVLLRHSICTHTFQEATPTQPNKCSKMDRRSLLFFISTRPMNLLPK